MANYNLVSKSLFNPFSFEELLKPAMIATAAHLEVEKQYSDLNTKANIWEGLADETKDKLTYALYKKYADDLRNQADLLASLGLNIGSRKALNELKTRYSSEITPIELAYAARKEDIKRQEALYDRDLSMMFERSANDISLDDYLGGKEVSYKLISGADLTKQVKDIATNLSKLMRNNPRDWKTILNGLYYQSMMLKGYTPEEIAYAAMKDPRAPEELRNAVESVISSSGIKDWQGVTDAEGNITPEGERLLNKAYTYAGRGLASAIGDTKYEVLANKDYTKPTGSTTQTGEAPILVVGDTPRLGFLATPKANELYIKYKDYFDAEGNLSTSGKRVFNLELDTSNPSMALYPGLSEGLEKQSNEFKEWIKTTLKPKSMSSKDILTAYNLYVKSVRDVQGKDTQEVRITPQESDAVVRLLLPSFSRQDNNIPAFYSIDWKTGETKSKGLINLAEINKDNPITNYLIVPVETNLDLVKIIATLKDGRMFEMPLSALGANNKVDFINSNRNALENRKDLDKLKEENKDFLNKVEVLGYNNLTPEELKKYYEIAQKSNKYVNNIEMNYMNNQLRMWNLSGEYESETGKLVPGRTNITIK